MESLPRRSFAKAGKSSRKFRDYQLSQELKWKVYPAAALRRRANHPEYLGIINYRKNLNGKFTPPQLCEGGQIILQKNGWQK
jgi:hypothetical protein